MSQVLRVGAPAYHAYLQYLMHPCPPHSDPPAPPFASSGFTGEFRCFMCAHPTCQFAQRKEADIAVSPCYERGCSGDLKVRKVDKSKSYVVGCSKYPSCKASWWLPKAVKNGRERCKTCANLYAGR